MDEIFEIQDINDVTMKFKKIVINAEKEIWQYYDIRDRKWRSIQHNTVLGYFRDNLIQTRKILIEKWVLKIQKNQNLK
jgi:hypothetical protein